MEYGAVWAQLWTNKVTFIIVDSDLNLGDVAKALRSSEYLVWPSCHPSSDIY